MPSDIAVYGLGVMGRNIALNMAERGLKVTVYNRTRSVTDAFERGALGRSCLSDAAREG